MLKKNWTFLGNKPKTNWKGYTPALVFHRNMVITKEKDQSSHVQTKTPENILTQTEANRFEPSAPMSWNQGKKNNTSFSTS